MRPVASARLVVPAVLVNAAVQATLVINDPTAELSPGFLIGALVSGLAALAMFAVAVASSLAADGPAAVGLLRRRGARFAAWTIGLAVVALIGVTLPTGALGFLVVAAGVFVPIAAMGSPDNPLRAGLRAIGRRIGGYLARIAVTAVTAFLLYLLAILVAFFIGGWIGSLITVTVVGLVTWWLTRLWVHAFVQAQAPLGQQLTMPREHTLRASDGVAISAVHVEGDRHDLCFVVVHGFTGNWHEDRVQKVIVGLRAFGDVIAIDMRGHGRSGGRTTVGYLEVNDVAAAVEWARELGYPAVVTVGFSLGGAVVLREAGLAQAGILHAGRVDAVVSVSAPAFWYYRGTRVMRLVHHLVETRTGRLAMRLSGTRISPREWTDPLPMPPVEAAAKLGTVPLLVVHGDVDRYFPVEHPRAIRDAAAASGVPTEMWVVEGFGHAESAISPQDIDRIGAWARECLLTGAG